MDVLVNVVGQKLKIATNLRSVIEGSQNFVRFCFNFGGEWDGLLKVAQFKQNDTAYDVVLNDDDTCFLPGEIEPGECTLVLLGSGTNSITNTVIATTDCAIIKIGNYIYDGESLTPEERRTLEIRVAELADDIDDLGDRVQTLENADKIFINVKDYGAKGDGTTDDSATLNAAFARTAANGGTVFFPAGTYIIHSAYVEFFSNTRIVGVPGATVLTYPESDADTGSSAHGRQSLLRNHTVSNIGKYDCTENVVIEGITFDGGDFMKKSTHLGIGHAKNITVRNCVFKNGKSNCTSSHYLELNACKDCIVEECTFLPEWHYAMDRDDAYAIDRPKYPGTITKWKKVRGKWNEQQRVYGEHINIDIARTGAYGDVSYYKYDATPCDGITIRSCQFESLQSNYFLWDLGGGAHGGYFVDNDIESQSDADAAIPRQPYISYAIGGHYYNETPLYSENNQNVTIHDCYFYGDWNVGCIFKNPNSIQNNEDDSDYNNLSIAPRRYTINASYMPGDMDGWVIRNNTFRAKNTGTYETTNKLPCGINLNANGVHNFIHDNTFINYDAAEIFYHNTEGRPIDVCSQHWNNINIATDGTVTEMEENQTGDGSVTINKLASDTYNWINGKQDPFSIIVGGTASSSVVNPETTVQRTINLLAIGDSLTDLYNRSNNWPYWLKYRNPQINITNVAVGGAQCCWDKNKTNGDGKQQISIYHQALKPAALASNPDIIVIFAGVNDYNFGVPLGTYDQTWDFSGYNPDAIINGNHHEDLPANAGTFYQGYSYAIKNIKARTEYANVPIVAFTPMTIGTTDKTNVSYGQTPNDFQNAIMDICGYWGVHCYDLGKNSIISTRDPANRAAYFIDEPHPNAAGSLILSRIIEHEVRKVLHFVGKDF